MGMTVERKTVAGTGWPLRNIEDLFAALTELSELGWHGGVELDQSGWKLRLSADGHNTVNVTVGQWLVLDGDLKAVSCAVFDDGYTSDPVTFPPETQPEVAVDEPVVDSEPFGSVVTPDVSVQVR